MVFTPYLNSLLKISFFLSKLIKTLNFIFRCTDCAVAMRTASGPSVAHLYLAYFEIKYLSLLNTTLYYRYLDDLFKVSENLLENSHFQ